jgi:glutaminyl-tRNA synthetase
MAVLRPLKVVIDNYPEGQIETLDVEIHPDHPEMGTRKVTFGKTLYVEQEDFMVEPVKKYFRLFPGNEVRLKSAYFVKCVGYDTDENGNVTCVHCTYDPESRGGNSPDGRKVKGTIHWVSADMAIKCKAMLYNTLFTRQDMSDLPEGSDFKDFLNPESLIETECYGEPTLNEAKAGEPLQFERNAYFMADSKLSVNGAPVFNRTVTLKDSYGK